MYRIYFRTQKLFQTLFTAVRSLKISVKHH